MKKIALILSVMLMILSFAGCSTKEESDEIETVTIVNMGSEPTCDMDQYYEMLDQMTEQWGIKIRVQYLAWGEETKTLQTMIAGGSVDAVAIGPWSNYTTLAKANAFYDLNKVIDEAPKLIEMYGGKEELKKLEINGKLNYIPQWSGKNSTNANGILYRLDKAKEWGIGEIKDIDTLEQYLYKAKEEYQRPVYNTSGVVSNLLPLFMDVIGMNDYVMGATQDDPYTYKNLIETDEFLQAVKLAKKWYDDGIINPDVLNSNVDSGVMLQDDMVPCVPDNHFASAKANILPQAMNKLNGGDTSNPNNIEFAFWPYATSTEKFYTENQGNTTGIALISKISDKKARGLIKFIEAAHTDKEFFDKFQYGIQGVSYVDFPTDTTVNFGDLPGEVRMYRRLNTGLTDYDLERKETTGFEALDTMIEDMQTQLNNNCIDNPINGFVFDQTNVENEVLAVNAVLDQYKALGAGITGDKTPEELVAELSSKLDAAGIDKIIDETNAQLKAYKEQAGL